MKVKLLTSLFVLVLMFTAMFAVPEPVSAADLVPCGDGLKPDCNFCHLVSMGNNVISFILGIVFVLFAVVIFVAGVGLVTSGGNQSRLEDAKKKLSNGLIGIVIAFSAWLIVDTLLKAALPGGQAAIGRPWQTISCS